MLNLYNKIFSRTEYSVSLAESFAEAFRLINSNDYDLLITDLMFPDGLGTDLIQAFRGRKAGAKSFLVSGSSEASRYRDAAPDALRFDKPFSVERFLTAVEEALA
jgi:DNA-binding NtrC family response regulator